LIVIDFWAVRPSAALAVTVSENVPAVVTFPVKEAPVVTNIPDHEYVALSLALALHT
jgi:hypothetical protein